ncbi:MAG: hypothetical protein EPO20_12305 [Betaproteobacteria bacterium]|nr:MAG: hypothetical protein EPO20_12305 [Betaproteobacteria bacterium]
MAGATASAYARPKAASSSTLGLLIVTAMLGLAGALGFAVAVGEFAAFFVAMAVVAGIAVFFDFRIGAVLLILILPLGATFFLPHSVLGVPSLNPFNIVIAATLVACVMGGKFKGMTPRPLVWLYVVPILVAGLLGMRHAYDIYPLFFENLTLHFTEPLGYFREMAIRPLFTVLGALLIGAAIMHSQKPERFLIPLMVSVWIMALLQFGLIAASGVRLGFLAGVGARAFYNQIGLHANELGRLYAVAYALMLFVWWETKNHGLKAALIATMGVATLAMVLTFSRGAFLGFFIVNAMFLVWKFNAKTLALALLAVAVVALIAPEYLWNRITFGFDVDANRVSADRIDGIWLPLLPELWKSPLWGNGLGSIMWSLPMVTESMLAVTHPHSAYLEAVLDMGWIGLVLMLAYYGHLWRRFRSLGSNAYLTPEMRGFFQGATAALVFFFVTGWVGSSFRPEPEFCFLWVAIGMMYGTFARKPAS